MYKVVKSFKRYKKALKYVAAHLSPENIEEINIVCPGANVEKELIGIAMQSAIGFFLFDVEGNPRAVGGISADRNVWFVVTSGLTSKEFIPWLKKSRKIMPEIMKDFSPIWGHCYEKNVLSRYWMKWNGFDFAPEDSAANYEIEGAKFIYFQKN